MFGSDLLIGKRIPVLTICCSAFAKKELFSGLRMEFKRKKDNIHPTRESSSLWVDSIMRWIPKSSHPFIVEMPSDSIGKVNPNIVFLKALNK